MSVENSRSKNVAMLEKMNEINDIIEQTFYLEQKVFEWSNKIKSNKERISRHMGRKNRLHIRVDEQLSFNVTKDVKSKIEFYKEELAKNLPKDKYRKIVKRTSTLKNVDKLIKMLKKYGVPSSEFKKFVETKETVDIDELDRLVEIGEIEIKDLQGCYKAEFEEKITIRRNK